MKNQVLVKHQKVNDASKQLNKHVESPQQDTESFHRNFVCFRISFAPPEAVWRISRLISFLSWKLNEIFPNWNRFTRFSIKCRRLNFDCLPIEWVPSRSHPVKHSDKFPMSCWVKPGLLMKVWLGGDEKSHRKVRRKSIIILLSISFHSLSVLSTLGEVVFNWIGLLW